MDFFSGLPRIVPIHIQSPGLAPPFTLKSILIWMINYMVALPIGSFKPQMSPVVGVTAMTKSQKVKGNDFYVQMKKGLEREQVNKNT